MHETARSDMLAATRFVRAGRLADATALLRRLLRDGVADAPASGVAPTIDLTPEVTAYQSPMPAMRPGGPGALPDALRGFLERIATTGLEPGAGGTAEPFPRPALEPLPDGAEFLARSYGNHAGSRTYKLYVPSGHRGRALPLVVMLHGCTQSPDDFAAGTRMNTLAEEQGCLVAYPAQAASANPSKCWNWFEAKDQARDRGEPALIAGITRQIMRDYPVDPTRVYVAGLSAGGAAAAVLAATHPELYAAVGVHSGLAAGVAVDLPSAFAAMQGGPAATRAPSDSIPERNDRLVPTIVFHGDQDRTVHPRNGDQVIAQVRAAGNARLQATAAVQHGRAPGGLGYRRTIHADTSGRAVLEHWVIQGGGHAWSGGSPSGSYTDPRGPDASREMLRFFLEHPHPEAAAHPIS